MMIRTFTSIAALAITSTAAMAAPVATLHDVTGTVLLDQGRGFVLISGSTDLASGTRVMLSRTGGATLVYAGRDGCRLTLSRNTITTVGSSKDCKPVAQVAGQAPEGGGAETPVGTVGAPVAVAVEAPAAIAPAAISPLVIGVGLSVAAAAGVALAVASAEDEQPQASP